jgi:hypothetical protein
MGTKPPEYRYVFLDQNHWIYLAKDYWGKPDQPRHGGVAKKLLRAVELGRVRLPLNTIHLIEYLRRSDEDARKRLAEVFEVYSRGWFCAAPTDILPLELRGAIARIYGQEDRGVAPVFGRGFMFGIGVGGRAMLRQSISDFDAIAELSAMPGMLFDLLTSENEGNRHLQNEEIAKIGERDASATENLRTVRKPSPSAMNRLAHYVNYTYELQKELGLALASFGKSLEEFLALGHEVLVAFWATVPSIDVDCELSLYRDRQWSRQVAANDTADLGHLTIAVPYCDAVVVERFWKRALTETRLGQKYGTTVVSDVTELVDTLES